EAPRHQETRKHHRRRAKCGHTVATPRPLIACASISSWLCQPANSPKLRERWSCGPAFSAIFGRHVDPNSALQRGREDSNPRLLVLEPSSYPLYKADSPSVATPLATPSRYFVSNAAASASLPGTKNLP